MKLLRLAVTNYKNLVDCELRPFGVHAITGCNSAGKSNLLEVFEAVKVLMAGSDQERYFFLDEGSGPNGTIWFPFATGPKHLKPLRIEIDAEVSVDSQDWQVFYTLEIRAPKTSNPDNPYSRTGSSQISHETIHAKLNGAPGRPTLLLRRETDGKTTAVPERQKRRRLRFDSKRDMSAMQALEIREAGNFQQTFPVLAHFRSALLASSMIRLSPESVFSRQTEASRYSGPAIHKFASLFEMLQQIQSDPAQWDELNAWVKTLCGIDKIELETKPSDDKDTSQKKVRQFMLLYQGPFMLLPEELSTGTKILLSLVTNLFHQRHLPGVILIEEPEMCVHPGAIVALIRLFRDFTERSTILFSTHSPVALNSMNPNEVSVLISNEEGFYTTQLVSSIDEAIKTLDRGFLSFGDLLQTNFTTDQDSE